MSINYFCSGFDKNETFWNELAIQLKRDINSYERITFISGSTNLERTHNIDIPFLIKALKKIRIQFEDIKCIEVETNEEDAKNYIENSSIVVLLGGNPFFQKELIESKKIDENLKNYNGVILGISAGAMNMSKYIIVTPCSKEYPDFDIRPGLNLSNISIYPHNNFEGVEFPKEVNTHDRITVSNDLLKVSNEYGSFYCLQDYLNELEETQVSLIRTYNDEITFFTNSNGKVWLVEENQFKVLEDNN